MNRRGNTVSIHHLPFFFYYFLLLPCPVQDYGVAGAYPRSFRKLPTRTPLITVTLLFGLSQKQLKSSNSYKTPLPESSQKLVSNPIASFLKDLYWLPANFSIQFKSIMFSSKTTSPHSLHLWSHPCLPLPAFSHPPLPFTTLYLMFPFSTMGSRAFSHSTPKHYKSCSLFHKTVPTFFFKSEPK